MGVMQEFKNKVLGTKEQNEKAKKEMAAQDAKYPDTTQAKVNRMINKAEDYVTPAKPGSNVQKIYNNTTTSQNQSDEYTTPAKAGKNVQKIYEDTAKPANYRNGGVVKKPMVKGYRDGGMVVKIKGKNC
jgi:hypothetical protein